MTVCAGRWWSGWVGVDLTHVVARVRVFLVPFCPFCAGLLVRRWCAWWVKWAGVRDVELARGFRRSTGLFRLYSSDESAWMALMV